MSDELTTIDGADASQPPIKRGRGRPKGSRNKVSKAAQTFCRRLTNDKMYRKKFKEDWKRRKVPPQIEALVWAYGHGKPVEQVNLNGEGEQAPTAFVLIVDGKALTPGADDQGQ
jgi:hypothetical protein